VQDKQATRTRYSLQMATTASLLQWDVAQFYNEGSLTGNLAEARAAVQLDPFNRLHRIQVARLEDNAQQVERLDPTLLETNDLDVYSVISFGRVL
jgi:hypothetical protein